MNYRKNSFKILYSLYIVNVFLYPLIEQIHTGKTPRALNEYILLIITVCVCVCFREIVGYIYVRGGEEKAD